MLKVHNNFDNVRIVLALIVFFSHAYGLTKSPDLASLNNIFDANFAVKGFFSISGFLVAKSYFSSKDTWDFFEKRVRRICPAYYGAILLCFFIGLFTTSLEIPSYLQSEETHRYAFFNSIFLNFLQPTLPGVFLNNPLQAIDGSLWTIKIEIMLYICVPFLIYSFRKFQSIPMVLTVLAFSAIWVYYFERVSTISIGQEIARQFPGQISYFACGAFLAKEPQYLKKLPLCLPVCLILLAITESYTLRLIIDPIAYTTIVLAVCTINSRRFNFGKYGDISYGIYLYHFPLIQLFIFLGLFAINIYLGVVISLSATLLLSLLSWNFLEKPFLKRSSHYVQAE